MASGTVPSKPINRFSVQIPEFYRKKQVPALAHALVVPLILAPATKKGVH